MSKWRLILDGRHSASYNMAADAYLLKRCEESSIAPTLRIYGWDKPSITIGYHQSLERAVDIARLGSTPVVRRPTGGRALLHDEIELTYALAGNHKNHSKLGESMGESYLRISQAIVRLYQSLGWEAIISHRDNPVSLSSSSYIQKGCFSAVSLNEILVNGIKMAAGSQRRARIGFMQHGSIKLDMPTSHPAILDKVESVNNKGLTRIPRENNLILQSLVESFEIEYSVDFELSGFEPEEISEIERMIIAYKNLNLLYLGLNKQSG